MSMLHYLRPGRGISLSLCLLLVGLLVACEGSYVSMNVQTSSTQINQPSTYSFTINRQYDPVNLKFNFSIQPVPPNTVIIITLPSQFVTISTNSTLSCINAANTQPLTCNVNVPAKTIFITDYYATNSTLNNGAILINVFNLINAFKAGPSDNFYWQIVAPNGTTLGVGPVPSNTQVSTSITFTPGTFRCNPTIIQPAPSAPTRPASAASPHSRLPSCLQTPFPSVDSWLWSFQRPGQATRCRQLPSIPVLPAQGCRIRVPQWPVCTLSPRHHKSSPLPVSPPTPSHLPSQLG